MISVCFITKNEERWIGECIEHLKPIVREFLVCDTGSTDRTIEIAKSHGAIVEQIEWPNDFSIARNQSKRHASQPWILKIDPDERLDAKDFPRLLDLLENPKDYLAFQFWTRAYTNDQSRILLSSYQTCRGEYPHHENGYRGFITYPSIRLYRNLEYVKFHGKIHETVEPSLPKFSNGTSRVAPPQEIYFHHYGHTDEMTATKEKGPLYQKLIQEELERNPNNWYVLFEFGNSLFQEGQYAKAAEIFERANHALPNKPQVLSNWGYAWILAGDRSRGEKILLDCLKVDPNYHDAHLNLGASAFDREDFQTAFDHFSSCLSILPNSFMARRARAQCMAQMGDIETAEQEFNEVLKLVPHFHEARVDLGILYLHTNRLDAAKREADRVLVEIPDHARAKALRDST